MDAIILYDGAIHERVFSDKKMIIDSFCFQFYSATPKDPLMTILAQEEFFQNQHVHWILQNKSFS